MTKSDELARAILDTTAVDIANALAAGTLERDEVPDELLEAMAEDGVEPDDDPDELVGWHWEGALAVRDGEG